MEYITSLKIFKSLKIYKGLPNSIYILFLIKVINAMGNFVFPFLTLYLTKKMGMSEKAAGTFFTIAAISAAPGLVLGGRLADHIGRKKVFSLFQAASVLCFLPCAFFSKNLIIPWLLILSAFFNGGAQPALGAMINDLTNPSNRKQAFSLLYLGNNIGFAVGPLLAGFLFTYHTSLLFIGNFITGIFAVIILMKFIKETIPKNVKPQEEEIVHINEKAEDGGFIKILFKKPRLLIFALISIIYSFVYAQFPFCGSLEMRSVFSRGPELYGVLMTINGLVVITMTTPIIRLTSGIKPLLNVAIAGVFFAVGMGMLYFIHAFPLFIISTIIWTLGEILNATNAGVYIANNTPSSHRGRFNAIIPLITGSGFALGPLIMGIYINGRDVRTAWPLVFIIEMGASVMIFILYIIDKRVESKIR
jgi:MFS family permease